MWFFRTQYVDGLWGRDRVNDSYLRWTPNKRSSEFLKEINKNKTKPTTKGMCLKTSLGNRLMEDYN